MKNCSQKIWKYYTENLLKQCFLPMRHEIWVELCGFYTLLRCNMRIFSVFPHTESSPLSGDHLRVSSLIINKKPSLWLPDTTLQFQVYGTLWMERQREIECQNLVFRSGAVALIFQFGWMAHTQQVCTIEKHLCTPIGLAICFYALIAVCLSVWMPVFLRSGYILLLFVGYNIIVLHQHYNVSRSRRATVMLSRFNMTRDKDKCILYEVCSCILHLFVKLIVIIYT